MGLTHFVRPLLDPVRPWPQIYEKRRFYISISGYFRQNNNLNIYALIF
jgi:hypothetical protein